MSVLNANEKELESNELMFSVASMIMSVGILTMPRSVAGVAKFSDGWISIATAGILSLAVVAVLGSLSSTFPKLSYFEYTSLIATRPIGYLLTGLFFAAYLLFTAYELRALAEVAKQYLFTATPIEVIALVYWLVVVYAVSGSRAGLLRLNMLFFPIVIAVFFLVLLLNTALIDVTHFEPLFVTDWAEIMNGAQASGFSFLGFEIVLMYAVYLKKPKQAVKAALTGTLIPFVMYLILYMFIIGVFSYKTVAGMAYPTVELAKEVEVPGAFFERFESFFFTIWIMTIFNTTAMGFDICIVSLDQMIPGISKTGKIFALAPLIYIISFFAQDKNELNMFSNIVSMSIITVCIVLPMIIFVVAKWRGLKPDG